MRFSTMCPTGGEICGEVKKATGPKVLVDNFGAKVDKPCKERPLKPSPLPGVENPVETVES